MSAKLFCLSNAWQHMLKVNICSQPSLKTWVLQGHYLAINIHPLPPPGSLPTKTPRYLQTEAHPPCSTPLQVLGTLLLWLGWYGFNCGSSKGIVGKTHEVATIAVNTCLAGISGGLTAATVCWLRTRLFQIEIVCLGILSGLVRFAPPQVSKAKCKTREWVDA